MNEMNEFGFRVGDAVPEGFFEHTMDEAMTMIRRYAEEAGMTPLQVLDAFAFGCHAKQERPRAFGGVRNPTHC